MKLNLRDLLGVGTKLEEGIFKVYMVDVVLQGVCVLYRINKDEGDDESSHLNTDVFRTPLNI